MTFESKWLPQISSAALPLLALIGDADHSSQRRFLELFVGYHSQSADVAGLNGQNRSINGKNWRRGAAPFGRTTHSDAIANEVGTCHCISMTRRTTTATPPGSPGLAQLVHFDLTALLEFEVGALFMVLMMHPAATEIDERVNAFLGLCAGYASEQVRSVPIEAAYLREARPEYFSVAPKDYRRALKQAKTLLRYRMVAAQMARPFIGQGALGDGYKVPPEVGELTPNNVAEYISAKHNTMSGENLMQRVWRPSLPVLHLAVGLENAVAQRGPPATGVQDPEELIEPNKDAFDLQDVDLIRSAVHLSIGAAEIIRWHPRIRIADHEIVEIRWDE